MSPIDPRRYLLSEDESRRIFREAIVPDYLERLPSAQTPTAVFICGQPGAGKTMTTNSVTDALAAAGAPASVINSDYYKPYHPRYAELLEADDRTAAPYTSLDGRRWMAQAQAWAIERRINIVIETTMRDPGDFQLPAAALRAAGYRTEAAILAVPAALSRLGIIVRYHQQVQASGHGRLTETGNHDASYSGVATAAAEIDQDGLVDEVAVYRRGNHLLYANQLLNGQWAGPPRAASTITQERSRSWDTAENRAFLDDLRRLRAEVDPSLMPALEEIGGLARTNLSVRTAPAQPSAPTAEEPDLPRCRVCNRPLQDPESQRLGIGPSCRTRSE